MSKSTFKSVIAVLIFYTSCSPNNIANDQNQRSTEKPPKCLVGYDWLYPSSDNPTAAWKFNTDQTFSYSSTLFGGMSAWGTWVQLSREEISISYTKTTADYLPKDQIIILNDCSSLTVGSTTYIKQ